MNLEAFAHTPIDRRESLARLAKIGLATATVAAGLAALPGLASAEEGPTKVITDSKGREWIVSTNWQKPWSDLQWYPLQARDGFMTLFDPNGPLAAFDEFARVVYGVETKTAATEHLITKDYLSKPAEDTSCTQTCRASFGHCDALASAGIHELEPVAGGVEGYPQLGSYSQSLRKGVLTAFHSMSAGIRTTPNFSQRNLEVITQNFIKTGEPFVIEAPGGREGMWYRAGFAVSVDGLSIGATNIGFPNMDISRSSVRWIDVRRHEMRPDHIILPKYQQYKDEVKYLYNPGIHDNYHMVKHFVTGKAA